VLADELCRGAQGRSEVIGRAQSRVCVSEGQVGWLLCGIRSRIRPASMVFSMGKHTKEASFSINEQFFRLGLCFRPIPCELAINIGMLHCIDNTLLGAPQRLNKGFDRGSSEMRARCSIPYCFYPARSLNSYARAAL
jgi:hypothetical protein